MAQLSLHSPVGDLTLFSADDALVAIEWGWGAMQESDALLEKAKAQLNDYFDGKRIEFNLPVNPAGTAFQRDVWKAISHISYGETSRYGDIAKNLNSHARAIGQACGKNPIPIIIPCHRIVGEGGKLGGYSGDGSTATKKQLLILEGALLI